MLELFFSPRGRIGRQTWWFGALGFVGVAFVLALAITLPLLSETITSLGEAPIGGGGMAERFAVLIQRMSLAGLILYAVLAYPLYCLCVKRRHDRGSSGWDLLVYGLLAAVPSLIFAFGWGIDLSDFGDDMILPVETRWMTILSSCLSLFGLYLTVVMGLLKGTAGPNAYGPDPLAQK